MAIRNATRRQLKLDTVYMEQGGVKGFVLGRLGAGEKVEEIAKTLTAACGETVARDTVYTWLRSWRLSDQRSQEGVTNR